MNRLVRLPNGFSVLEAMAALMVLNLMCLGLMAWQLQAMQAQRDALSMQQAVAMAQDLWQRMQVHPGAVAFYQLGLDEVPNRTDCQSRPCSAAQRSGRRPTWRIGGWNCDNGCRRPEPC